MSYDLSYDSSYDLSYDMSTVHLYDMTYNLFYYMSYDLSNYLFYDLSYDMFYSPFIRYDQTICLTICPTAVLRCPMIYPTISHNMGYSH